MINEIDKSEQLYKISFELENLSYKISHLEDEMAKLNATITEINEEKS